jgi:curli biogenesis system outer membrane secretion channel CsgG
MKELRPIRQMALVAAMILAGCGGDPAMTARSAAQPDARPMRNVTSFSEPLRCMDDLLSALPRRTIVISSTEIPDDTRRIFVGADDMLISALSQMNRNSHAYVFLDQLRLRDDGMIELLLADPDPDRNPRPQYYIRGSISQLDSDVDVREAGLRAGTNRDDVPAVGGLFGSRKLSVVSVDLHLVEYRTRQVIPGASVANSMVVVSSGRRGDATGVVEMSGLNLTFRVDRVESQSQAVRNLIELGLIELIGRHAGVPFQRCLAAPTAAPPVIRAEERSFGAMLPDQKIRAALVALVVLGYLPGPASGVPDGAFRIAVAKFQVDEHLIASGEVDVDTNAALRRKLANTGAKVPASAAH